MEPFGFPADDLRHGLLCATVIAPHLRKGATADPRNYMLRAQPQRELTPQETVAYFRAALGGGAKKKG